MFADDAAVAESDCSKQVAHARDRLLLAVYNMVVLLEKVHMTESNRQLESRVVEDKAFHKLEDNVMDLNTVEVGRKMLIRGKRLQLQETWTHLMKDLQLMRNSDRCSVYHFCHSPFCDQKSKS